MDSVPWDAVRARFDELVELAPEERTRRLDALRMESPALHDAVARLLDADGAAAIRLAGIDALIARVESATGAAPGPPADPAGLVGTVLSRFRVLQLLGAGGMGAVYRAEDTHLGRTVAVKVPMPAIQADASGRARFLREARAAAMLDHPAICEIHEVGEAADGRLYLAMPLYPGETLRDRLARDGALAESEALDIVRQVAAGLATAHAAGVVHRDLKPGNVMLLPGGGVKLLDFGLAKVSDASVTGTGGVLGTVAYMAPEQLRAGPVDGRTDLWALGVMLYEMVTGRRPFIGDSDISVAHAILHDTPLTPARQVSPALADVTLRLLERDPARRFQSADAVLVALEPAALASRSGRLRHALTAASRTLRQRRGAVAAALGVAVLAGAVAMATAGRGGPAAETWSADSAANDLYVRGRAYEARGLTEDDYRSAIALYQRAITRDPAFALARARLAISMLRLRGSALAPGEADTVLAQVREALAHDPALGDAHLASGLYWTARSELDSALSALARARASLPQSTEVAQAVAVVLRRVGRWQDAVVELERARALAPGDLETARILATTYSRLRRYDDAAAAWEEVTTLVPDDFNALLIKGYTYLRLNGSADTLAAVLQRIPARWDAGGMKTYATVLAARMARTPRQALALLDSAPARTSADFYTWRPATLLRAQVHDDLGDTAAARRWYAQTLTLVTDTLAERPGDARLHITLGWARAGTGDTVGAAVAARRAMALRPLDSFPQDGLVFVGAAAEVLARAGDGAGALQLLDSLFRLPAGREVSVPLLRADPTWDRLRPDPAFQALLARYAAGGG